MKKQLVKTVTAIVLSAVLISAFSYAAYAEEPGDTEAVQYDFGTEGIIDFTQYPETYKEEAEHPGTVTTVTYDNGIGEKFFNIYLPYGYEDNTDNYNVLYIVHGGGGSPENYLKTEKATAVQKVIDHMFEDGVCDPFIMVAVSWKATADQEDTDAATTTDTVRFAREELPECIIPYVDENYRTNADREHRAFTGFSRGGRTSWDVLMNDLRDFATIIPLSGPVTITGEDGERLNAEEGTAAMAKAIDAQGIAPDDFRIFAATGSIDTALEGMAEQIFAMQDNEMFRFGENTFFGVMEGIAHGDPNARYYLYTIMPMVW